MSAFDRALEH